MKNLNVNHNGSLSQLLFIYHSMGKFPGQGLRVQDETEFLIGNANTKSQKVTLIQNLA